MTDKMHIEELSPDNLDEVSGGKISVAGYASLQALIWQMKKLGKDKEYCINSVRNGWNLDCQYKTDFTDGTDEDLQRSIAYIEKHW